MKTKSLLVLLTVIVLCMLVMSQAGAKRDDLYEEYEKLTAVVDKILSNYVSDVDKEQLFYGAFEGMLGTLDPYSQFLPPMSKEDLEIDTTGEFGGVGIEITLDEHKTLSVITPLEGTPAFSAGVRAGDKIWKISGESTEGMTLLDAVKVLRGKRGKPVTITVTHETDPRKAVEITIVRDIIKIKSIVDVRMVDDKAKIGYVRMTQFQEKTESELDKAITKLLAEGMRALILDLRFNPGGLLSSAAEVCDRFIDEGTIVSTKGRNGVEQEVFRAHNAATYHMPLAVLVSGRSASASEIVAGALQDHKRAAIVGSRTYGKGSVQTIIPLDGGKCAMRLTTAYYYTPSGRLIHRKPKAGEDDDWGIYPDVKVEAAPEEYVRLWQVWRKRHIEENRASEDTPEKETADGDVENVKTGDAQPAGDGGDEFVSPEDDKEEEPPFVDRQLEAARLFLTGQLFRSKKTAAE
jgi:carboxyl-terminal processing protease